MNIFCPQCGAEYRVPADALETRVRCRHCQRVFSPKATIGARRRPGPSAATFVWAAAGVAALILIGVLIKSIGSSEPARTQVAEERAPVLGLANPRVQAIRRWVEAVAAGNSFGIEYGADLGALQTFLDIDAERNYSNAYESERPALRARIREELATGERARVFRELQITEANLLDAAMLTGNEGAALVRLEPRDLQIWAKGGVVKVAFRMKGPNPVVTGWDVIRAPELRAVATAGAAGAAGAPNAAGDAGTDPGIETPTTVRAFIGGKTISISESELVPLDHLADTSPELRAEIDRLISDLLDLEAPGPVANQCVDRLDEIGKPAVPRLLNQFHELSSDLEGRHFELIRIDRALRALTGRSFGYNAGMIPAEGERLQEQRISALKQWYAWWYRNHDRAHDLAIDKQDGLPPVKIKK